MSFLIRPMYMMRVFWSFNKKQKNEIPFLCGFQLDLRTKLCIRDSLYRLARSAEQRHNNHAGISGPLLTDGTNKYVFLSLFSIQCTVYVTQVLNPHYVKRRECPFYLKIINVMFFFSCTVALWTWKQTQILLIGQ